MRTKTVRRTRATDEMGERRAAAPYPTRLQLRLYTAGDAPNSSMARANLRRLLDRLAPVEYSLEIIDCFEEPLRALEDGVLVTPTLVRLQPEPRRVIVGSLSAAEQVAQALDLTFEPEAGATRG